MHGTQNLWFLSLGSALVLLIAVPPVRADGGPATGSTALTEKKKIDKEESPWLLVPTLSSNPKLGTTVGVMAGYMHYFDPDSKVSIFGLNAKYTSTNSVIGALFAKMSFAADHQRLNVFTAGGNIKNDYDDFLGTGMPLKSEDHLRAIPLRYLYGVWGNGVVGC